MRLYLDTDDADSPAWESFEYIVEPRGNGKADVLRCVKDGWNFEKVGEADYTVSGNSIQVKLDRALLHEVSQINFKWTDNTCIDGDIMDVYIHGDAAPGGRFKYQYIMK